MERVDTIDGGQVYTYRHTYTCTFTHTYIYIYIYIYILIYMHIHIHIHIHIHTHRLVTQHTRDAFEVSTRMWRRIRVPSAKAHYAQTYFDGIGSQAECGKVLLYRLLSIRGPVLHRRIYNQVRDHQDHDAPCRRGALPRQGVRRCVRSCQSRRSLAHPGCNIVGRGCGRTLLRHRCCTHPISPQRHPQWLRSISSQPLYDNLYRSHFNDPFFLF